MVKNVIRCRMPRNTWRRIVFCNWWLAVFCAVLLGCKKSDQLDTSPVHGTIKIDGKPLTRGTITFVPERGRLAIGKIQPDGSYSLSTYVNGDGAVIGKHRVKVSAMETKHVMSRESEEPIKSLIPERYGIESTSGFAFEVKSGQDNSADFDLSAK